MVKSERMRLYGLQVLVLFPFGLLYAQGSIPSRLILDGPLVLQDGLE